MYFPCLPLFLLVVHAHARAEQPQVLHVVSSPRNDVFTLLSGVTGSLPCALRRYDALDAALAAAAPGDGLLVLANGSEPAATAVSAAQYAAIVAARLSGAYVEMPASLPGANTSSYTPTPAFYFDRLVVFTPALLAQGLAPLDLLVAQGAAFQGYPPLAAYATDAMLGYAHVAGSETAIYGLTPPAQRNPVLFPMALSPLALASPPVLIAAIALSCVVSCRYTPQPRWRGVWDYILSHVLGVPVSPSTFPSWRPLVGPSSAPPSTVALTLAPPPQDLLSSLRRATDFLAHGSGLLVQGDATACPSPHAPAGAPLACMLEGFASAMSANGSQAADTNARVDCSAEAAMAFAVRALVDRDAAPATADEFVFASAALLDWTWRWSDAAQGPRANASDPAFGLLMWGVSQPSWRIATYGDDNARALLGSLVATSLLRGGAAEPPLDTHAWDVQLLTSVLANARIASSHGFRPGRIDYADIERSGWRAYAASGATYANASSPQPHYQAQMWGVFVWTWAHTGWEPLWAAAAAGVEESMAAYTTRGAWRWTEYHSEEVARLLLPVAWLVRGGALRPGGVNATHIAWLYALVDDLLATQQPCGAIHETLGAQGLCDACPPASNAAYGTAEAPLIAATGDPITDLLYGSNFALVSLQEAYAATLDWTRIGLPTARLADFLTRAQLVSDAFPQLSGSWMRAFDTRWWEPWGSAADSGWGPWAIETGWTTTWITAGLHAAATNSSLWDLTLNNASGVNAELLHEICPQFGFDEPCP